MAEYWHTRKRYNKKFFCENCETTFTLSIPEGMAVKPDEITGYLWRFDSEADEIEGLRTYLVCPKCKVEQVVFAKNL